jgi:hypothetical protein
MSPEYRQALLSILAKTCSKPTPTLLREPGSTELQPMAAEVRELFVDMQAKVEEKLDK